MSEDRDPFIREDPDTAYRRGTVLGLTVAEVFILLLFLLMLVFLALAQEWEAMPPRPPATDVELQLEKAKSTLNDVQDVVQKHRKLISVPEEAMTLVEAENNERTVLESPVDETENNLIEELEENLVEELEELLQSASEAIRREKMKAQEAKKRAIMAESDRDKAQKEAVQASRNLDVLRTKGHNPPCWYEKVLIRGGRDREKPYYTFKIAVFDESMVLRRISMPSGGASDDKGSQYTSYVEESKALQLARIPYNVPLDDEEVIATIRPIHDAGKNEKIRTYSCIFWAQVWDQTSVHSKERWKDAHDRILEGLLGTYLVSDAPWKD